jgi:hypothetical protein
VNNAEEFICMSERRTAIRTFNKVASYAWKSYISCGMSNGNIDTVHSSEHKNVF